MPDSKPAKKEVKWVRGQKAIDLAITKKKKLFFHHADGVWREADMSICMHPLPNWALTQYGVKE